MKAIESNKTLVFIGILLLGGLFLYRTFFSSFDPTAVTDITTEGAGRDVVSLYQSLQSVTLDTTFLSTPSYRALTDFSVPLTDQAKGRRNPFDKI